ncbi:hypothetical protein Pint_33106 [Pistacia integerrima]|uniref:Uncharacterized protein n=1 Tax=Pistacia integerrima TaxID=434235 RepID=A0ACC0X8L7_9ROSI|nr:hypothetical protein Pint_33106 [Pistacia integerrima]
MKGPLDRTKVVVRSLPPAITQAMFIEQIDGVFAGLYNWVSFRQGKTRRVNACGLWKLEFNWPSSRRGVDIAVSKGVRILLSLSQKHQSCSRAYIDFKRPEDVLEFADLFNGHVFVNEKGAQFKAIVEYASSQRVPKQWSKKDGREGTILKDPEYLEFLEFIAKPVENLPSAEIQLERKEAERAGAAKEAPIVTPLMDFVRQKRAAKAAPRRLLSNGKLSRRAGGSSSRSPGSGSSKRGFEKKRSSTTMYVLRDSAKHSSGKDKSNYIVVRKQDDQQGLDKLVTSASATGSNVLEESGISGNSKSGKKKILLLKGEERDISLVSLSSLYSFPFGLQATSSSDRVLKAGLLSCSDGYRGQNLVPGSMSQQQSAMTTVKTILGSPASKRSQRRESSGRMIRSILLNKDARQSQFSGFQSEQHIQNSNIEKDKRPPRPPHVPLALKDVNGVPDEKIVLNDLHSEKQERRTRNKDRPDRGVWTVRRSDGSYASDESLSSSASQPSLTAVDSSEGSLGDVKTEQSNLRSGEVKTVGSGRGSHSSLDNGTHRHVGCQGSTHVVKDADGSSVVSEGKPSRRGGGPGYGSHEKQVWVQKSSSVNCLVTGKFGACTCCFVEAVLFLLKDMTRHRQCLSSETEERFS